MPSAGDDRLVVLAEPYSHRWRATLAGHALTPTRAYGWAQAWVVPAAGGVLRVGRDDGDRQAWLLGELVVVVLALLLCVPARGRQT